MWNIEQEKDREKEKVGGRPANLNEKKGDRDLERKIKKRRHVFDWRTTWNFRSGGDKIRNAGGHESNFRCKWAQWKKVNEITYDISPIKSVTKKFLEVSRCSRAKQRQKKVQKKCAAREKLLFC